MQLGQKGFEVRPLPPQWYHLASFVIVVRAINVGVEGSLKLFVVARLVPIVIRFLVAIAVIVVVAAVVFVRAETFAVFGTMSHPLAVRWAPVERFAFDILGVALAVFRRSSLPLWKFVSAAFLAVALVVALALVAIFALLVVLLAAFVFH